MTGDLVELRLSTGECLLRDWIAAMHGRVYPVYGHEMCKFILRSTLPVLSGRKAVSG